MPQLHWCGKGSAKSMLVDPHSTCGRSSRKKKAVNCLKHVTDWWWFNDDTLPNTYCNLTWLYHGHMTDDYSSCNAQHPVPVLYNGFCHWSKRFQETGYIHKSVLDVAGAILSSRMFRSWITENDENEPDLTRGGPESEFKWNKSSWAWLIKINSNCS